MLKREAETLSADSSSKKPKTELSIDEVRTKIVKTLAEKLIEYAEKTKSEKTVKKR